MGGKHQTGYLPNED